VKQRERIVNNGGSLLLFCGNKKPIVA